VSGPNQVWQLDFSEFETRHGGVWRIAGCADYWSKLELGWHVSTTANHRDAIEAVELAIAESERHGLPLQDILTDPCTGEIRPIALVSDNGPYFKAARFAASAGRARLRVGGDVLAAARRVAENRRLGAAARIAFGEVARE
jgi:putative transposase